jgi:hypothetical protein
LTLALKLDITPVFAKGGDEEWFLKRLYLVLLRRKNQNLKRRPRKKNLPNRRKLSKRRLLRVSGTGEKGG